MFDFFGNFSKNWTKTRDQFLKNWPKPSYLFHYVKWQETVPTPPLEESKPVVDKVGDIPPTADIALPENSREIKEVIKYKLVLRGVSDRAKNFAVKFDKLEDAVVEFKSIQKAIKNYEQWWSPNPKLCKSTFMLNITNVECIDLLEVKYTTVYKNGIRDDYFTDEFPCIAPEALYDDKLCQTKKKKKR
jgi:hypothetical protein